MPEFKYHFNFIGHILSKYIKLSSISTCPRLLTLELEDFSYSNRGVWSKWSNLAIWIQLPIGKGRQCHGCQTRGQSGSPTVCSFAPWTWRKPGLKFFLKWFHSILTPWAFLLVQLNIREASLLLFLIWWGTLLLLHHIWAEFGEQLAPLRAWSRCIPSLQFWVVCSVDESGMLLPTCERQQQLEQE